MANKPDSLTNPETPVLDSPVSSRGRGTTGGGGTRPSSESARLLGERLGSNMYSKTQRMWMARPGCGVKKHDADCLCDVQLPDKPTPVNVNFPHDITFALLICEHMGYEAPYAHNDVLDCLQMAARAKDMLDSPLMEHKWRENQKVPHDARKFMRECAEQGMRNKEVRRLVMDTWGVEVSAAYISKRRYLYTGEKGTTQ